MLKLGIPSKGRLLTESVKWFDRVGLKLHAAEADREYYGRVQGLEGVESVLLSAGEIPGELGAGNIHVGVTGTDMIQERIPNWTDRVREVHTLEFGHAELVVAVPRFWLDVETVHDLDEVAAQFRQNHMRRLRVATKYHFLAREFLSRQGVADYQLVDSRGATEGTVASQAAEAIIDIVSTGSTLAANGLKRLSDGLILKSQATLFESKSAQFSDSDRSALETLLRKIESKGQYRPAK